MFELEKVDKTISPFYVLGSGGTCISRIGEKARKVNKYRSRYFDRKAWKPRKQDNGKGDEVE